MRGSISLFGGLERRRTYGSSDSFSGFIAKRKQASRTPNASRIMTSRSMSEPQCLQEQPNLAAAFVSSFRYRPPALVFEGLHSGHSKSEMLSRRLTGSTLNFEPGTL